MIAIRSHMIVGCAASIAAGLVLSVEARADQNLNCDAYAAAAVAQQNENLALRCGFAGGGWSANYEDHRAWCLLPGVAMANLTHEDRARGGALELCKQKQAACGDYATLAVEQNRSNRRFNCGLAGGRWSDNATGHRDWCMAADVTQATNESSARQSALLKCAATRAGDEAQLADINLQSMQQKQQQVLQTMSNISKAMHESAMGVIRKRSDRRVDRKYGLKIATGAAIAALVLPSLWKHGRIECMLPRVCWRRRRHDPSQGGQVGSGKCHPASGAGVPEEKQVLQSHGPQAAPCDR